MTTPPIIVLVPGAFHVGSIMKPFEAELRNLGYPTQTLQLTTVNSTSRLEDDIMALTGVLVTLIEEQVKDIVLYLHSYAGFPGSAAIKGLSKAERLATEKQGGILGLIYQSAFIPRPKTTLLEMIGGQYAPWQNPNEELGLVNVANPKKVFYADVLEPLVTEASNQICGQSLSSFNTSLDHFYYDDEAYERRRVYLHTTQDQALPPLTQNTFVFASGVRWNIRKLYSSHSPFWSQPAGLAQNVKLSVEGFQRTYLREEELG